MHAVHLGKTDMVNALLAANADANASSRSGDTALHWAAFKVRSDNRGRHSQGRGGIK